MEGYDAAGNRTSLSTLSAATSGCQDSTAPSAPTALTRTAATAISITLSWTASTDNVGVTGYTAYSGTTSQGTTTTTSYTFTGLACGTAYTLGVEAYDAAGNRSTRPTLSASTAACADTTAPSTPTGLLRSAATTTSITLSWSASTDNVGVTGYSAFRDGTAVATTIGQSYTFTGLACGVTYILGVEAFDAAVNRSARSTLSAATAACPDTTAPSAPTALTRSAATTTSITLAWTASTDDVTVTGYSRYLNGTLVSNGTGTSFAFTGLACGATYLLGVEAYDAAGNRSARSTLSAATAACLDTTAPSAPSALTRSSATATSITLTWTASTDNVGVAGYTAYRATASQGDTTAAATTFTFTGLACGTVYTLGVEAYDAAGNRSTRPTLSASTAPCPDSTAPSAPTGLLRSTATATSITLAWTASTDNVGVTGYSTFRDSSAAGTVTSTSSTFTGLACGTTYTLGVEAYDAAGNRSTRSTLAAPTSACPDTTAPTAPTGLTPTAGTTTSITLTWANSSDNVGVTGYQTFRNGTAVTTTTGISHIFTGLTCGTSYTLGVEAYDAANNRSSRSTLNASTNACPDTTAPTAPPALTRSAATTTSITLSWTASTDNVGVTGYTAYSGTTSQGTTTTTSYTFTGLACGTAYTLGVEAYDAAGNRSTRPTLSASTAACAVADTTPPSVPQGQQFTGTTQTSTTMTWSASTDNVGVSGYRAFLNGAAVGTTTSLAYTYTGLTCGTTYTVALEAYDAAGNASNRVAGDRPGHDGRMHGHDRPVGVDRAPPKLGDPRPRSP